jgi:ADP-ribosylglycohydrolase
MSTEYTWKDIPVAVVLVLPCADFVRSSEALASAMLAVIRYGNDPEMAVIQSVNWGGDADSVGAIVGSLMGALYGVNWYVFSVVSGFHK